jgi:hypothetical protein
MCGYPVSNFEKRYAFFAKFQINFVSIHAIIFLNRIADAAAAIIIIVRRHQI